MKLIHLADLHLGKRVNEFSMLEDQQYILREILRIIDDQKADAVMIAGDVYDKSVPSAEAVELFDEFLVRLSERGLKVLVISGNHDSPERIAFGGRLMDRSGIYMSPVYHGEVDPVTLEDPYGRIHFYLLPFIKPAQVRRFFPDREISSYTDAVAAAIDQMHISTDERNVLLTHQFVTGAQLSDSEDFSVGGSDNVDASVFEGFDYVALGHIHRSQKCGSEYIRYSGTPLKYSFSEASHQKSVTVVDIREKGNIALSFVPLIPRHDMQQIRGTYDQVTAKSFYENTTYREDYMHITLTDEEDVPNALSRLRVIYRNIMKLDYDNRRTRHTAVVTGAEEKKTPFAYFSEFYALRNGHDMSPEQAAYMKDLTETIWEGAQ